LPYTNKGLGWKGWPQLNTLAYYSKKGFVTITTYVQEFLFWVGEGERGGGEKEERDMVGIRMDFYKKNPTNEVAYCVI
jgi:hypothetical protein